LLCSQSGVHCEQVVIDDDGLTRTPLCAGIVETVTERRRQMAEEEKPKKSITIIVDGTARKVDHDPVTYAEVVTLAYPDYPQHPEINYSVTYKEGPHANPEGILAPGGDAEIKEGMEFRVKRTGQS
jgi:hypothetical protein